MQLRMTTDTATKTLPGDSREYRQYSSKIMDPILNILSILANVGSIVLDLCNSLLAKELHRSPQVCQAWSTLLVYAEALM